MKELVAIIPVAGVGTRLAPMTRALPKAMFPLIGPDGAVRPVAEWILKEALEAGCSRTCFVCSSGQEPLLRSYFQADASLAGRIEYISGVEPFGFGYAVWAARGFAAGDDVLVLLGDHIHLPAPDQLPPARQVAEAFAGAAAAAMVGVQLVGPQEMRLVGVCRGQRLGGRVYRCERIVEKPAAEMADELASPGLPAGQYLAHAGIYAFSGDIFEHLDALVAQRPQGKEVGLTDAQQLLLARHRQDYLLFHVAGSTHDMGTPARYLATMNALARQAEEEQGC